MIQRIQTVYLLIAFLLCGSMIFTDLISFTSNTEAYFYNICGIFDASTPESEAIINFVAVSILLLITPLVSLTTILLYKKRLLQIRLCAINIGLLIGVSGLLFYVSHIGSEQLNAISSFKIPAIFSLISAILTFMALKAIGRDEALIRSMDRIR